MSELGSQATTYWEFVASAYFICTFVLCGLIFLILFDGKRQRKLLAELEKQERKLPGNEKSSNEGS